MHEEQREHAQQRLRAQSRLFQEREQLSASVEATIADLFASEDVQSARDENKDESTAFPTRNTTGKALIPPLLSLQSKVMPAVRLEATKQATSPLPALSSSQVERRQRTEEPEVDEAAEGQGPSIFTRFARQVTSSLAALGSSFRPGVVPLTPQVAQAFPTLNNGEHHYQELRGQHLSLEAQTPAQMASHDYSEKHTTPPSVVDAIPAARPSLEPFAEEPSRQRLGGHTGKIKLQTAPSPAVTAKPPEPQARAQPVISSSTQVDAQLFERFMTESKRYEISEDSVGYDALPHLRESGRTGKERETTATDDVRMPGPPFPGKVLFGSGDFARGQGDARVERPEVRASSIVTLTLTSNPGPTLVQYISLQPGIGFTAHLTAPAESDTSFNYMLVCP